VSYKRTIPFDADNMHFAVTTLHPSHADLSVYTSTTLLGHARRRETFARQFCDVLLALGGQLEILSLFSLFTSFQEIFMLILILVRKSLLHFIKGTLFGDVIPNAFVKGLILQKKVLFLSSGHKGSYTPRLP
jgi:hypothetical protein